MLGIHLESAWNLPGFQVDSGWTRIHMDPSEFGWVLTDMIFLPNSNHSYHSTWIQAEYMGEGKVLNF